MIQKNIRGIITKFRELYIKTKIFPLEFSDIIKQALSNRGESDYNDFFIVSKDKTIKQIENAKTFLSTVETYIESLDFEAMENEVSSISS
jgi:uncharacterized protein (UPF0332 family)